MPKEAKSRTEKETFIEERIFGGEHYKTTISDEKDKVVGRDNRAEEAEKRASDKWEKKEK